MTSKIKASRHNNPFVTQLVTAFRGRDLHTFRGTFAHHADPSRYKYAKDSLAPSDYGLLCELCANQKAEKKELSAEDVLFLLGALKKYTSLSTLTKTALYLMSFNEISQDERDSIFGAGGALHSDEAEIRAFKEMKAHEKYAYSGQDIMTRFRKFYQDSISPDQTSEDFSEKFNLVYSMGARFFNEINRLNWRDSDEDKKFEFFKDVLNKVDQNAIPDLINACHGHMISYKMLKLRGVEHFDIDIPQGDEYLQKAFSDNEDAFFGKLAPKVLGKSSPTRITELKSTLIDMASNQPITERQLAMLDIVDQQLKIVKVSVFQHSAHRNNWDTATHLLLGCIWEGDQALMEEMIKDSGNFFVMDDFLIAVLNQIDVMTPSLDREGLMGEAQKSMIRSLHNRVYSEMLGSIANIFQNMDISNQQAVEPDPDRVVGIPYSQLTQDQRERYADQGLLDSHSSDPFAASEFNARMVRGNQPHRSGRQGGSRDGDDFDRSR